MNDYEIHVQDSDELGPGSDLVISMFAMAMLVLAFIGSGFGNEGSNTIKHKNNTEYNELQELRNRVSILEEENNALKHKEISDEVIATLRDSAGTSLFQKNNTTISEEKKQQLLHKLRQQAEYIYNKQINTIIIEGYASPEPRLIPRNSLDGNDELDTNDKLAFDRARTVSNMLVSVGIPRHCLGLMSYGRNRSEILYGLKPNGSENDIKEFDNDYLNNKLPLTEEILAAERRIDIRVVSDPKYKLCTSSELAQHLSDLDM